MTFSVRIDNGSGDQETVDAPTTSTVRRSFNQLAEASIVVPRTEASGLTLTEGDTEVYVVDGGTDQFGGPLKSVTRPGDRVELAVESFERHAKNAKPTAGKLAFNSAQDTAIFRNAIENVPELSVGQTDTIEPGITTLFYHATRALQARRVREISRGEIRYNEDKTVDYLSEGSFGSDKTGTTLSPANQNITDVQRSQVKNRAGSSRATHLRVIGGGDINVDVVADSYSSGDEKVWGRAAFPDVIAEATLRTLGEKLLEDLSTQWREVRLSVIDESPTLGDEYTVDYPELGIDSETLRVVELRTTRDNSGTHHNVTLSNRPLARQRAFTTRRRAADAMRTGQTSAAPNIPNANIPFVRVPAGDNVSTTIEVPSNLTLLVWQSNIRGLGEAGTPATSVTAQVVSNPHYSGGGTVAFESGAFVRGSPLVETDAATIVDFRINNGSNDRQDVAASWSYTLASTPSTL